MTILFCNYTYADNITDRAIPYQLEDLVSTPKSSFPACDNKDYYWYQQSGPDFVNNVQADKKSLVLQADHIVGQESGAHIANGNVVAYRESQIITADWLSYNQPTSHVVAGGGIVISQSYNVVTGKWMDYYMDLDHGVIHDATVFSAESDMYGKGSEIKILNSKQIQIESGYFTSCDPNDPDWYIKSKQTNFDYQDSQGTARSATFYAADIPVATIPYMQFPLGQRRSGFLVPEIGYINSVVNTGAPVGGAFFGIPYYWNMAPNYDMTLEGKVFQNNGFMVSDLFRYKNSNGQGSIYTEQLPNDWQTGTNRYYWSLKDTHTIAQDLNVGYTYNAVSDNNYFVNFGNATSAVTNINLERAFYANYTPHWGTVNIKAQGYQVLQPINQPSVSPIYATLPQINFNVNPQNIGSTMIKADLQSQYSNFTTNGFLSNNNGQNLQSGQRTVIYPSLTMPIQNQWGFVKPKFGYNYTNYQLDPFQNVQTTNSVINRGIPITSLDTGLVFDRPVSFLGNSYSQTLEPRLYYLYIPAVNQQNNPIFDTAPATYNINQLFSENRFVGYDRINMANDVTMGFNSKLIDANSGTEYANWGIGYRYFITPENSFIYGNTTEQAQLFLPRPNAIAEINNNWSSAFKTNGSFQYSTTYSTIDAWSLNSVYNPEKGKLLNAGITYQSQLPLLYYAYTPGQIYNPVQYENQYAIDISGQWPIYGDRWLIDGRTNYDLTRGLMLNWISGVEYNGGCWSVQAVYQSYITNIVNQTSAFFLQFSLKGLANVGSDPQGNLKTNIPGYVPITNIR